MKKLLFFPLVLISCLSFAQDAKEIIGKTIKIGNLLVAQNDFSVTINGILWEKIFSKNGRSTDKGTISRFRLDEAEKACRVLGKGWRLPTKDELNILYQNKDKIGGFKQGIYWSSTKFDVSRFCSQSFNNGNKGHKIKTLGYYVRAIRAF